MRGSEGDKHTLRAWVATGIEAATRAALFLSVSSRGTMSMRKSKWSDLERARAISDFEIVRRLCASATRNARHVSSWINTAAEISVNTAAMPVRSNVLSHALQKRTGANYDCESESESERGRDWSVYGRRLDRMTRRLRVLAHHPTRSSGPRNRNRGQKNQQRICERSDSSWYTP